MAFASEQSTMWDVEPENLMSIFAYCSLSGPEFPFPDDHAQPGTDRPRSRGRVDPALGSPASSLGILFMSPCLIGGRADIMDESR